MWPVQKKKEKKGTVSQNVKKNVTIEYFRACQHIFTEKKKGIFKPFHTLWKYTLQACLEQIWQEEMSAILNKCLKKDTDP